MLALVTLAGTACTTEQAYNTVQASQRNQCGKLPEKADFDRCMAQAQTPYEVYKQQNQK